MDLKLIDRAIGTGTAIILLYYIIGVFIPILTWGVIGLVALRIYLTYQQHK